MPNLLLHWPRDETIAVPSSSMFSCYSQNYPAAPSKLTPGILVLNGIAYSD